MESPDFTDSIFLPHDAQAAPRPKLDRARLRAALDAHGDPQLLETFEALWSQIDETELTLAYYEIEYRGRTKIPRNSILFSISKERQDYLRTKAHSLSQKSYLTLKRELVDLRTSQYTLKDCVLPEYKPVELVPIIDADMRLPQFGSDIMIAPLGLSNETPSCMWTPHPNPNNISAGDLTSISNWVWRKWPQSTFDFRDTSHLDALVRTYDVLEDAAATESLPSVSLFLKTWHYYLANADLSDLHRRILEYRILGWDNARACQAINLEFGTSYHSNYISTLYWHKVLEDIAFAATSQYEMASNICFPENWKQCRDCGKWYLATPTYFMRRAKSADGLAIRCKSCDKIRRTQK